MALIRANQPVVTRISPHNKNRRYIKAYGFKARATRVIPNNALLTRDGDVLTTRDGDILTGGNNVPTSIEQYLPFFHDALGAQFTTQVEADDNANPTNWVDIATLTVPAASLVAGDYDISAGWSFNVDSTARSAYFRFLINGVATSFIRVEAGDSSDVNAELLRRIVAIDGLADLVVTGQCVLENIGGTDTLTIEAGDYGVSVECKVNNQ